MTLQMISNILDVALVSILFYWILLLVKGTRTIHMLIGFIVICMIYSLSGMFTNFQLVTVNIILGNFLGYSILIIVTLFQEDFRKMLVKVGVMSDFSRETDSALGGMDLIIPEIVKAAVNFSEKRRGALMVIERNVGLAEYSTYAVKLDAVVTEQLLHAIFHPSSPIHDGAVIINDGRLLCAGAVLPLTFSSSLDKSFGTRHRAAIGISERTDAVVIVVSEESGKISVVRDGYVTTDLNERTLISFLTKLAVAKKPYRTVLTEPITSFFRKFKKKSHDAFEERAVTENKEKSD